VSERATLTIEETARVLGISRGLAYELARRDPPEIPVLRLGRKLVVPRARLAELLGEDAEPKENGTAPLP
jgi:excisionase family DNA binding protein